jgi:phosphoribosyl 1,2-cyclic phosphodiesterase
MRFASLGSGSRGNAHLLETDGARVLLDCGFAAREVESRLARLGVSAQSLDAILVTHEHADHIRGLGPLARRYGLPTWMTSGTYVGANCGELPRLHTIDCHEGRFMIGDLEVLPYPVPHDSREPCQFVFQCRGLRLGVLTDTGRVTPHILAKLQHCDSLILEFNHDQQMLANGPYPPSLQARVGGGLGHLNNDQSLALLANLETGRLQHLVAAHLSEKNNSPECVRQAILDRQPQLASRLSISAQHETGTWRVIQAG